MTHLWLDGCPIRVRLDSQKRPAAFYWRGRWHPVAGMSDGWRVDVDWWQARQWHDYFTVYARSGLLAVIYHDLLTDTWHLLRLYD